MSEYQWVEFRAVDAPLDDAALAFMHKQSTRAEIDRWSFTNEYHYGDFHGNVLAMMRRGYDVHVHYTNFGLRRICLRIPDGFAQSDQLDPYLLDDQIQWSPDDDGTGGVLTLEPEGDAGTWDWMEAVESLATDLIPLREMIIAGDLRPLYIAHVAFNYVDEDLEPPVPAGLGDQNHALDRLCEFYEVDSDLLAVAAEISPTLKAMKTDDAVIESWLQRQSKAELCSKLKDVLLGPHRHPSQLLRKIRAESVPTTAAQLASRTIGELRSKAEAIAAERQRQHELEAAQAAERRKAEAKRELQAKLTKIADDPKGSIARIDAAIHEGNRPAYQRAAQELSLLAQACGKPAAIAKAKAIRTQYPSRSALSSELKKAGF